MTGPEEATRPTGLSVTVGRANEKLNHEWTRMNTNIREFYLPDYAVIPILSERVDVTRFPHTHKPVTAFGGGAWKKLQIWEPRFLCRPAGAFGIGNAHRPRAPLVPRIALGYDMPPVPG